MEGSRHVSREAGRKVHAADSLDNPTAWSGASGTESVEDLLGLSALPRHERMNLRRDAQAINIGLPSGWEQASNSEIFVFSRGTTIAFCSPYVSLF